MSLEVPFCGANLSSADRIGVCFFRAASKAGMENLLLAADSGILVLVCSLASFFILRCFVAVICTERMVSQLIISCVGEMGNVGNGGLGSFSCSSTVSNALGIFGLLSSAIKSSAQSGWTDCLVDFVSAYPMSCSIVSSCSLSFMVISSFIFYYLLSMTINKKL